MRATLFMLTLVSAASTAAAQLVVEQSWTAEQLFAASRSSGLMVDDGRITLEDRVLVEDDGPACGYSSNPSAAEVLSEGIVLRKTLVVDRLPARAAWVTALLYPENPPEPNNGRSVVFTVNGHEVKCEVRHFWTHAAVPPGVLKKGNNEVLVRVLEPDTRFKTWVALDENFAVGSETRVTHPNRSARSADGGKTFDDRRLGVNGAVDGEYSVRLALQSYRAEGWMESPVVDMAQDTTLDALLLPVEVKTVSLDLRKDVPRGTGLALEVRTGPSFAPTSPSWSPWQPTNGSLVAAQIRGRFLQFRMKATSPAGDLTPAVLGARVRSDYAMKGIPSAIEYRSVSTTRYPTIRSSFPFEYEDPTFPRLREFRKAMRLDSVVGGARTELETMLRIKGWVARQWVWHLLKPEQNIVEWDAPLIMTPGTDGAVEGGFCLHYAVVLMQALQSFGISARIVSVDYSLWGGHEVVEAWSNQYGKWIFLDADLDTYFVDRATGVPLNVLEMHDMFVRGYFPGEVLDRDSWSREDLARRAQAKGDSLPVIAVLGGNANSGTLKSYEWWNPPVELSAYCGGYGPLVMGFLRYMPRGNYLSKPRPIPVNHGRTHWGWTGYRCWYDPQTPRTYEHEVFTNRASDLYWNLYQIDFSASEVKSGLLQFDMDTNAPSLREFEVTVNGTRSRTTGTSFDVTLERGLNRVEMRTVDVMGAKGAPSVFECIFIPRGEQN